MGFCFLLGSLQKVPVVVCDSNDDAALAQMVTRTKVVVTTVGPYTTVRPEVKIDKT